MNPVASTTSRTGPQRQREAPGRLHDEPHEPHKAEKENRPFPLEDDAARRTGKSRTRKKRTRKQNPGTMSVCVCVRLILSRKDPTEERTEKDRKEQKSEPRRRQGCISRNKHVETPPMRPANRSQHGWKSRAPRLEEPTRWGNSL